MHSCYYDNLEKLNPQDVSCDTAKITYKKEVVKIMGDNCTSCHSGASASGGITLDNYNSVKANAVSGKLYSSIIWDGAASPMPKGSGSKINDCSILIIKKWIQNNYPQ